MAEREDEPIEIVKRIESPKSEREEKEESFYVHETIDKHEEHYQEEEREEEKKAPSKGRLSTLFGIGIIGIIGYFGVNYLNKEHTVTQAHTIKTPVTKTETKEPKELTPYIEDLAIKRDSQKIEENVIATLSAQKKAQQEAQKQQTELEELEKQIELEPAKVSKPVEIKPLIKPVKELPKTTTTVEKKVVPKKLIKQHKETPPKIEKKAVVVHKKKVQRKKYKLLYEKIKPRIITVEKGDSLASIAKRFYGNPMDFKRIIRANSRLKSQKTALRLGEKIIIPRKDNKKTRRYILVQKGNTLASISKGVYGSTDKISKIVRANYRIKNKSSTLRLGQKIYVPK
jgi:nucleoid-associated protein YgaU